MYRRNQTSSIDQNAQTPPAIMQFIMDRFGLTWDPCPPNYTIDGLSRDWAPGAYVNPPFKHCRQWLRKAQSEGSYAVFLLPATKLHCRDMESIWPCIGYMTLLSDLITFQNYSKPLNKAMTLLSLNCHPPPGVSHHCHAYYWSQLKNRTIDGLMSALQTFDPVLVTARPSQQLPALLQQERFVILMPSRLDLKSVRQNLHLLTEIIFCPNVKQKAEDKDTLWIPPIILTRGCQIATLLEGMHQHPIPVQWLNLKKSIP